MAKAKPSERLELEAVETRIRNKRRAKRPKAAMRRRKQPQTITGNRPRAKRQITKPWILVVEDKTDELQVMTSILEKEGFGVLSATSRAQPIQMAKEYNPDVIIVDAVLPDATGYELAFEIKLLPQLARVPVIGLSAYSSHKDAPEPPAKVFAAYLTKPVRRAGLVKKINELLEKRVKNGIRRRRDKPLKMKGPLH